MTPDERQLLSGLFDRIAGAANQPRDREAETFISDRVRSQPYAPYLLSQTVIVQDQALKAAAERIQQLESQIQQGSAQQPQEETSFLGSIGKSLFGGSPSGQAQRPAAPPPSYAPQQPDPGVYRGQGGPWGQGGGGGGYAPAAAAPQGGGFAPQGGGFLRGALGAAAGVAGGVLAADAIRGLFGGHNNPFGIASGLGGGLGGGFGAPGGETIVNNYYEDSNSGSPADLAADDARQDFLQDQADDFDSDGSDGSGGDDSSWA